MEGRARTNLRCSLPDFSLIDIIVSRCEHGKGGQGIRSQIPRNPKRCPIISCVHVFQSKKNGNK